MNSYTSLPSATLQCASAASALPFSFHPGRLTAPRRRPPSSCLFLPQPRRVPLLLAGTHFLRQFVLLAASRHQSAATVPSPRIPVDCLCLWPPAALPTFVWLGTFCRLLAADCSIPNTFWGAVAARSPLFSHRPHPVLALLFR